jgi:CspA family cold shock protein
MLYGTVSKIAAERGFGFIAQEGRMDVWFHATVVEDGKFEMIQPDQPVMFELEKRDRESKEPYKPRAALVKLIDRIPGGVLARPPQSLAPKHHPRARQSKPKWRKGNSPPGE